MVMGCADQFNKLPMGLCRIISSVFSSCVKWHLSEAQVCADLTEKAMRSEPQSLMLKRHTEPDHLPHFRVEESSFHGGWTSPEQLGFLGQGGIFSSTHNKLIATHQ